MPPLPYKDHLITNYINEIIKSGLLLDEDLEVILTTSDLTSKDIPTPGLPCGLLVASCTAAATCCTVFRILKLSPGMFLAPPIAAVGVAALWEVLHRRRKERHYKLVRDLIEGLKNCADVNKKIYKYVKTREKVSENSRRSIFTTLNVNIKNLLQSYSNANFKLYNSIYKTMDITSGFNKALASDFEYYKSLDPTELTKLTEDVLKFLETWHDVQTLLNSKVLSYLGVIFSQGPPDCLNKLLDEILPKLNREIDEVYKGNNRILTDLNRMGMDMEEVSKLKFVDNKQFVSVKLKNSLEITLHNVTFIVEKTRNILTLINKDGGDLTEPLLDLRNHTLATYESLDVLCKLYGIVNKKPHEPSKITLNPPLKNNESPAETINYDDETEPNEEQFELYLDADNDENQTETYQEPSENYVGLMLQELKQSLRQHERFREARRRRGSQDSDVQSLPDKDDVYFDLSEVKKDETDGGGVDRDVKLNMLDSIKILSGQRQVQEDTFGTDDDDDDDDDYH